jgi:hypothetical protein
MPAAPTNISIGFHSPATVEPDRPRVPTPRPKTSPQGPSLAPAMESRITTSKSLPPSSSEAETSTRGVSRPNVVPEVTDNSVVAAHSGSYHSPTVSATASPLTAPVVSQLGRSEAADSYEEEGFRADDSVSPYRSLRFPSSYGRVWIIEYWQEEDYLPFIVFSGPTNPEQARSHVSKITTNPRSATLTPLNEDLLADPTNRFQIHVVANHANRGEFERVSTYRNWVTAQEFHSFLESKPAEYTAVALWAHVDLVRTTSE